MQVQFCPWMWLVLWSTVQLQGQSKIPNKSQILNPKKTEQFIPLHLFFCILPDQDLFWETDVYGSFQICSAPSTLNFMNLCWLLISWQADCCKQLIFYVSMKCNHEFYDVIDWWPSPLEQGELEDLRFDRNGWLLRYLVSLQGALCPQRDFSK